MNNDSVIVFVHGGPGLSSSYFKEWFEYLRPSYDLFFYDQDYSKCSSGNAIEVLSNELVGKTVELAKYYSNIVFFAHSWGTFLLLSSIKRICSQVQCSKIRTIILSNPADLDWTNYQDSGNHLFDDMSESEIEKLSSCTDGLKIMQLALPYYVANHNNVPPIVIDKYDLAAYGLIDDEMRDYNIRELVDYLPLDRTHTIYCEFDFEKKEGSKELAEKTITHEFPGAGHFPFAEQPVNYASLIKGILT